MVPAPLLATLSSDSGLCFQTNSYRDAALVSDGGVELRGRRVQPSHLPQLNRGALAGTAAPMAGVNGEKLRNVSPPCVVWFASGSVWYLPPSRSPVQNEPPTATSCSGPSPMNESGAIQARPIQSNLLSTFLKFWPSPLKRPHE